MKNFINKSKNYYVEIIIDSNSFSNKQQKKTILV